MKLTAIFNIGLLLAAFLSAGHAAAQANLEINTPGIAAIQGGMQKRPRRACAALHWRGSGSYARW